MDLNDLNCPTCQIPKSYITAFDAYFCKTCNVWLEENCGDPTCNYCNNRPQSPNDVNEIAS